MGLLGNLFTRPTRSSLTALPTGSFTVDPEGQLMTSTLPTSFPSEHLQAIGRQVLDSFRAAQAAQLDLNELIINYAALRLLARELRGGAIVFMMPQTHAQSPKKP